MAQMVALPSENDGVTDTGRATRVLVVDDHVVFAQLVERALRQETDLTCIGTASSLAQARRMFTSLKPDVVLMDVRLPDGDAIRSSEPGSLAVNPKLLHQLVRESGRAAPGPDLTQREREVLRMLAEGSDLTLECYGHRSNRS